MENKEIKIDITPIQTFLTEDIYPKAFAELLDEFIFDYMAMLVRIQLSDEKDKTIHEHTDEFLFYLKKMRDILPECEKNG